MRNQNEKTEYAGWLLKHPNKITLLQSLSALKLFEMWFLNNKWFLLGHLVICGWLIDV